MRKKIVLGVAVLAVILGGGAGVLWYKGFFGGNRQMYVLVKDSPALVEIYKKTIAKQTFLDIHPEDQSSYFDLGLYYKSLGEQGNPKNKEFFLKKSLAVYEAGAKKFGETNILYWQNAANLATGIGDYPKAEQYLKKAIEISPADDSPYSTLAELYATKMNKPMADVLAVYEQGIKKMFNPTVLIWARGSYLRRIGQNELALKDYETLVTNFPNNQAYKDIVQELKSKIKPATK